MLKLMHKLKTDGGTALCLFALLLITTSGSQAATLEEVYDLAVRNDPELGAAQAVFLSRTQIVAQNRALVLPNISVRGRTSDNRRARLPDPLGDGFNDHGWSAVLNQSIFRLDSWFKFQQAKDIRAEARANFAAEQQALVVRVAESYFAILEAEAGLSASNAERDAVQRQLEQVQQRFDVGLVAITDVLESQAAFDSSTVSLIEAEGAQSSSFEPLVRLTGSAFAKINGLAEKFPVRHPEPQNEEAWVKLALQNNHSLAAARERLKSARRGLQLARANHYPTIDAQVTWTHNVSGSQSFLGEKVDQSSAALSINVPIIQGGGMRARAKSAKYDLEAAQMNLDLIQRQVVEATRNLFKATNTNVARVRARLRGIESSQSALDATQTGYEVGTRNIVDVLNAQRNLYLSEFQYAQARYRYVLDTLRLKQAVGSLSPQDIYDLNRFINSDMVVSRTMQVTR